MLIINYIPKIQALDKSIALLSEVQLKFPNARILTIADIEEKNQIDDANTLFGLVSKVSDELIFFGYSPLHLKTHKHLEKNCYTTATIKNSLNDIVSSIQYFLESYDNDSFMPKYFFLPFTGTENRHGIEIVEYLRSEKFKIISYFKSLHDQDLGFSARNIEASNTEVLGQRQLKSILKLKSRLKNIVKPTVVKPKEAEGTNFHVIDVSDLDVLLAFNETHRKLLVEKLQFHRISIAGYQLLYEGWKKLILESSYCREYKTDGIYEVVLFTRGETPGKLPEHNVVPNNMLKELLHGIFAELDMLTQAYRVRVKPHPIQDVDVLKLLIRNRSNVSISYEPPSLLAATADLVISTYSSTVIDALIFGIPSIEYFVENDFFKAKHPAGSPFIDFGVLPARNKVEFRKCLHQILSCEYQLPDIEQKLDQKPNLNFLSLSETL